MEIRDRESPLDPGAEARRELQLSHLPEERRALPRRAREEGVEIQERVVRAEGDRDPLGDLKAKADQRLVDAPDGLEIDLSIRDPAGRRGS